MSNYKLRLTASFQDCSGVIQRFAEASSAVVVYQHSENCSRVHIHALVKEFTKSYDTAVNWMKQICPDRADRQFCATYTVDKKKVPVDDSFISYMSKGSLEPVFVQGFSTEVIADYKAKGYDKGSKDIVDVVAESGKLVKQMNPSKKLQIQLLEEMRAELGDVDIDSVSSENMLKVIRLVCMRNHYYLPKGLYKLMEFRDNLLLYGNSNVLADEFSVAIARRQRL